MEGIIMLSQMEILRISKGRRISPEKICRIADVCEKYGIMPHGNVFRRTPEDLEKIILMLKENGLDPVEYTRSFLGNPCL